MVTMLAQEMATALGIAIAASKIALQMRYVAAPVQWDAKHHGQLMEVAGGHGPTLIVPAATAMAKELEHLANGSATAASRISIAASDPTRYAAATVQWDAMRHVQQLEAMES